MMFKSSKQRKAVMAKLSSSQRSRIEAKEKVFKEQTKPKGLIGAFEYSKGLWRKFEGDRLGVEVNLKRKFGVDDRQARMIADASKPKGMKEKVFF